MNKKTIYDYFNKIFKKEDEDIELFKVGAQGCNGEKIFIIFDNALSKQLCIFVISRNYRFLSAEIKETYATNVFFLRLFARFIKIVENNLFE